MFFVSLKLDDELNKNLEKQFSITKKSVGGGLLYCWYKMRVREAGMKKKSKICRRHLWTFSLTLYTIEREILAYDTME